MRLRSDSNAQIILNNSCFYLQNPEQYQKQWQTIVFKNNKPIYLEIGAGKGNFIISLAKQEPNINFVALEKYETILGQIAKKIKQLAESNTCQVLQNLRLIFANANILLTLFSENEISRIYLNFSDPWPKKRHEKRRLTHQNFLKIYQKLLINNGEIHLKTDNKVFFNYSLINFKENGWDLIYKTENLTITNNNIETEYEQKFRRQGININYAIFKNNK